MINVVIVDDEKHCQDRLQKLFEDYLPDILVLRVFNSIEEAYVFLQKVHPDILFLDIQINTATGFDLLEKLGSINFEVIFTTAFEHYALKAIKFSAFEYLLKPVDPDDLIAAVEKWKNKKNDKSGSSENYHELLENFSHLKRQNKKITIHTQTETLLISISDIIRCESEINYTTLFLNKAKPILVSKTLKEFEQLLSPFNFCRIHNSHLINLDYMKSYDKGKGGYVHLLDNSVVEVSVRRKDDLMKKLENL